MNREAAIVAIAVSELTMVAAIGVIAVVGIMAMGRGIEWVLMYRQLVKEDRERIRKL